MHEYTDITAARAAAESVGIPLTVIDARDRFNHSVIPNFIEEYTRARTPNPCIVCNSEVKFRLLCDFATENGFDAIATGHYANIIKVENGTRYAVKRAGDGKKDQTYMLWRLPQDILSMLVLPLGDMTKEQLRENARAHGLSSADAPDSQEICFIPDGDYATYIEERTGVSDPGDFVDCEGRVLGQHNGIINYTVGQRKGLGIALGARAFVKAIDPDTNRVIISLDPPTSDTVSISGMVFSAIEEPSAGTKMTLSVKLRYQAPPIECTAEFLGKGRARLLLSTPARSLTPGQSAVLYDGDTVLAGGFIDGE
jgi:tRNA-specific 2-thiouridylase